MSVGSIAKDQNLQALGQDMYEFITFINEFLTKQKTGIANSSHISSLRNNTEYQLIISSM